MLQQRSLKWNFLFNSILRVSAVIFPLLSMPYVSRILLPEGTGKVAFATSVVYYFNMFAQLGIPTYGIRACAKVRENKTELTRTVHEIMAINLITCIIAYITFFLSFLIIPKFREEKILLLIVSLLMFFNAIGVEWLYEALEQYTYITIRSLIFKAISLVAIFLLIHNQEDYIIYGGIVIFATSASNVMNFFNMRRYISFRPIGEYDFKRHLKSVFVFFAMSIATTVYTQLDVVMLGCMTTNEEVGYYNTAVKVKVVLVSVITSLGAVILPRASYYVEQGKMEAFRRITKKAFHFVLLFACPMFLYFFIYAKQCILLLAGEMYMASVLPMRIIMPTLLFIGLTNIFGIQILVPLGRERTVLNSEIAGAVVDLILNLILIPAMGAAGAAIGTVAAEFVVLIVQFIALRKTIKNELQKNSCMRILVALTVATVLSVWVLLINMGALASVAISAICFFGSYGGVLVLMKEPLLMETCQQILGKLKNK